jgi:[glutamine synthetase] adenylyltransferase / [glutamine synthetase]-adenylyl-L-tyrosine phosphorylase
MDTRFDPLLAPAPEPEAAARYLDRLQQEWPTGFDRIAAEPSLLRAAVALFSHSKFLSEFVLRDPASLLDAMDPAVFDRLLTVEDYLQRLAELPGTPAAIDFARFRRRQILRIVLRDILGVAELSAITHELSNLADAILETAFRRLRAEFAARYGEPRLPDGAPCGFSVISLGKLGGQELNYSSDIDLMFVYAGNGETDGAAPSSEMAISPRVPSGRRRRSTR